MSVRVVDESDAAIGWIESSPQARASHALAVDGHVWIVDPVEPGAAEQRLLALGEPAGVIQLLDRHNRACRPLSEQLGVPLHVVPEELPDTPFVLLPIVRTRFWKEMALWWPARRVLVCADAVGTAPFFRAGAESIGVHPMLRFAPPRRLLGLDAEHVLVGHGEGLSGAGAGAQLDEAIRTARRRLPRWLLGIPGIVRRGY